MIIVLYYPSDVEALEYDGDSRHTLFLQNMTVHISSGCILFPFVRKGFCQIRGNLGFSPFLPLLDLYYDITDVNYTVLGFTMSLSVVSHVALHPPEHRLHRLIEHAFSLSTHTSFPFCEVGVFARGCDSVGSDGEHGQKARLQPYGAKSRLC